MGTFLSIIAALPNILQLILGGAKLVESFYPEGGSGKKKLEKVGELVTDAYNAATGPSVIDLPVGEVTDAIEPLVTTLVGVLNAIGVFKSSSGTPPTEAGVG